MSEEGDGGSFCMGDWLQHGSAQPHSSNHAANGKLKQTELETFPSNQI